MTVAIWGAHPSRLMSRLKPHLSKAPAERVTPCLQSPSGLPSQHPWSLKPHTLPHLPTPPPCYSHRGADSFSGCAAVGSPHLSHPPASTIRHGQGCKHTASSDHSLGFPSSALPQTHPQHPCVCLWPVLSPGSQALALPLEHLLSTAIAHCLGIQPWALRYCLCPSWGGCPSELWAHTQHLWEEESF